MTPRTLQLINRLPRIGITLRERNGRGERKRGRNPRASDQVQLWSHSYHSDLVSIVALQREVAASDTADVHQVVDQPN